MLRSALPFRAATASEETGGTRTRYLLSVSQMLYRMITDYSSAHPISCKN